MKKLLLVVSTVLLAASVCHAQNTPNTSTATANLTLSVGAEAAIQVNTSPAFQEQSGTLFGDYATTTDLTWWVRTITGGKITVEITTDFSAGGAGSGPSVANPASGDALTYTCNAATAGITGSVTACGSAVTASTTTATNVVTFGAATQSAKAGDDLKTAWNLTNDPNYAAGSYTAVATYTISAS